MSLENQRNMRDANLSASIALPAAAATAYTDGIDLSTKSAGRAEDVELAVELPATPDLVDAKTVTLTVQESDDDGVDDAYAAQPDLPAVVVTGSGSDGGPETSRRFQLPIGLKRFIRLKAVVLTAGGDNTAIEATLALCF